MLEDRRSTNIDQEVERMRLLSNVERHQADVEQAKSEASVAEGDRSGNLGQESQAP